MNKFAQLAKLRRVDEQNENEVIAGDASPVVVTTSSVPQEVQTDAASPTEWAPRPKERIEKASLNVRIAKSHRRALDRLVLEATELLDVDITKERGVDALLQLLVEDDDVRRKWLRLLDA